MKPEWEEKMKQGEIDKVEKLKKFQETFLAENPEIVPR